MTAVVSTKMHRQIISVLFATARARTGEPSFSFSILRFSPVSYLFCSWLCHDKSPCLQLPLMSMVFALKLPWLKRSGFLILQMQFLPLRPQGWPENLRSPCKDSFNQWKQYEATSLTKKVAQCALKSLAVYICDAFGCLHMHIYDIDLQRWMHVKIQGGLPFPLADRAPWTHSKCSLIEHRRLTRK